MKDKRDDIDRQLDDLTPDDLESFSGHILSLERWKRYCHIRDSLKKLLAGKATLLHIHAQDTPSPKEPHCSITLTFDKYAPFGGEDVKEFSKILAEADAIVFLGSQDKITMTIGVSNIWEE